MTYCMQIRVLTVSQNLLAMCVPFYIWIDIRLIIYLFHLAGQVYSGFNLNGCELFYL